MGIFIYIGIMADWKNGFLLYKDLEPTVAKLSNEEAGKLFKHLLQYVNDKEPTLDDRLLELVFEPIKQSLKRDLKKRDWIRKKRAEAWKLWGLAKLANASKWKQKLANVAVNDSVSVSDSVSDSVINKKRSQEQKEKIWKTYPHARKWKKQEAMNYIIKQDYEVVLHTVNIYKWEVQVWLQDAKYVPWCHLWCRDFVAYSEMIAKNKLKEIYNRLLEWRKTEEIKQFTDDFWKDVVMWLYAERTEEQHKLLLSWLQ